MSGRRQVQISVIDPRFGIKVKACALYLGPQAYARGKASRSRVLALALDLLWAQTPQGKAEKEVAEIVSREARRARTRKQSVRQAAVFALAIHCPEAWTSVGGIDREWIRNAFSEEHVKAIAGSDWNKIAVLLSVGEGCSNAATMKEWLEQNYDGGGYRSIATLLSDRYVPVGHNTIKRFADALGIVPRKRGPRGKAGP